MIAILHNIRSVHNTGSIFRTADGLGIERLFLCGITPSPLDRFGEKRTDFIKASLGAEDFVPWEKIGGASDSEAIVDLIRRLKQDGYIIISLEQHPASVPIGTIHSKISSEKITLIVGNEVEGIPEEILNASDHIVEIPMHGKKESFNVSVAFGIAAYELNKRD